MRRAPFVLLLAVLCSAAPARSADERAAALLRVAARQFGEARFGESIATLERARGLPADLATRARVQLYLGLNRAVLGQGATARAAFRAALSLDPRLRLSPDEIKPAIVAIFEEERARLQGELVISAAPAAEIWIDGKRAGPSPQRVRLAIGAHRLEARTADGCFAAAQDATVAAGSRALALRLERTGASGCRGEQGPRTRAPRRLWTWIAAGTAAAVLIAGIGVGASAQVDYREYQTTPDARRGEELADAIAAKDRAANVLFGVGAALAAGSAVLFFVEGRARTTPAGTVRLEWAPPFQALVRGSF